MAKNVKYFHAERVNGCMLDESTTNLHQSWHQLKAGVIDLEYDCEKFISISLGFYFD